MAHKHTAIQDESGIYALHRDDNLCLCPKLMFPQIVVQQTSPMRPPEHVTQLHQLPCTTKCPFAQVREITEVIGSTADPKVNKHIYEISCEGGVRYIELDEVKKYEKPSPLTIAGK